MLWTRFKLHRFDWWSKIFSLIKCFEDWHWRVFPAQAVLPSWTASVSINNLNRTSHATAQVKSTSMKWGLKRENIYLEINGIYISIACSLEEHWTHLFYCIQENCDIAIAMSSSRADPVLGLNTLSYCPGSGYLNILGRGRGGVQGQGEGSS